MKIEDLDVDILKILSKDSTITYHAIADQLKKSPITIKKHVKNLKEKGIIKGYGIQIDYEKLGYGLIAVIEVTVNEGEMLVVERKIAENPHVFGVYDITGSYDTLILARFQNRGELSRMIKEIHKSPYVERTNTHIILNVIKDDSSFSDLIEVEEKAE